MVYALIKDDEVIEYPVFAGEIMLRFPNTSFPTPFVPPNEYQLVEDIQAPAIDYTQNISEGTPVFDNGIWKKNWIVTPATDEQIQERTSYQWELVRSERNYKLEKSDWTQLRDAPTDANLWEAYRQQLRDITEQSDPFNIIWPTPPQT
jgi:hypothetical protein